MIIEDRHLWIDLHAAKNDPNQVAVLIEIKGFENMPSPVEYLAQATGKYAMYRATLNYLKIDLPLYLAVPEAAYHGILSEEIGKQTLLHNQIRLLIFDPVYEEIVAWIN